MAEEKSMELQRISLVIRRCPFCLKDTEQDAYYAHNPDLKVAVNMPNALADAVIEFKSARPFEWYGVSECKTCGNTYVVQGAIAKINKDITGVTQPKRIKLAYTCCDFCFNEENNYVLANMLITLRNGRSLYLCERHSTQIKKEKGRKDNYDFLIKKTETWG